MTLTQIFQFSNLFVLPFWGLMILLPQQPRSQRILSSPLPFVLLAGLYLFLLVGSLNVEDAQALANPTLDQIAVLFSQPKLAAIAWTHFLVMDLFVGRWIYWEGQKTGVWTTHSLILCLFAGPSGLLSHIVTTWIMRRFFADRLTAEPVSPDRITAVQPTRQNESPPSADQ
jgi:Domain of unknown function (DUF4281)